MPLPAHSSAYSKTPKSAPCQHYQHQNEPRAHNNNNGSSSRPRTEGAHRDLSPNLPSLLFPKAHGHRSFGADEGSAGSTKQLGEVASNGLAPYFTAPKFKLGSKFSRLSVSEIQTIRSLITGYRESAAFLNRSAEELEALIYCSHSTD